MNNNISEIKSEEMAEIKKLYYIIEEYACEKNLNNTKKFLPETYAVVLGNYEKKYQLKSMAHSMYDHELKVCKMLIDIELPINSHEMDIILSGALGHLLSEIVNFPQHGKELQTEFCLDDEISNAVKILSHKKTSDVKNEEKYYEEIQKNKYTLLINLAEMAIATEQFYRVSFKEIDEYLRIIREYFFPMCIYAKEKYYELELAISLIMEKVKLLSDVTEILSRRYRDRRKALIDEILVLKEENARLRVSIRKMEEEKKDRCSERIIQDKLIEN